MKLPFSSTPMIFLMIDVVSASSNRRMIEGLTFCMIAAPAAKPLVMSGNMNARNWRFSGCSNSLNVALVMMPSVPSEPMKIWFRSGPAACLGTGSVWMMSPLGRTTSI